MKDRFKAAPAPDVSILSLSRRDLLSEFSGSAFISPFPNSIPVQCRGVVMFKKKKESSEETTRYFTFLADVKLA